MPNDAPSVDMSSDAQFNAIENGIALAHAIVDTVRDPLLVLDPDLRIVAASRSFYQTFQLVPQDSVAIFFMSRWRPMEHT